MSNVSQTTQTLLNANQAFAPNYQGKLSNHLSMTLIALERCGASAERIQAFYDHYCQRLDPLAMRQDDAPLRYGQPEQFVRFRQHYQLQLETFGVAQTLHSHLDELIAGVSAAAFHALIRLAYALEAEDIQEIAAALAYWATEYQPLTELECSYDYDASEHIQRAYALYHDFAFSPGIIVDRVRQIISAKQYAAIATIPYDLSVEQVARITIEQYRGRDDFTLLHGVTGFDAFMSLRHYLSDPQRGLHYFWQAYVAAFASTSNQLTTQAWLPAPAQTWPNLMQRAALSQDDHTIKLTYSCARLAWQFPLNAYQEAIETRLVKEGL